MEKKKETPSSELLDLLEAIAHNSDKDILEYLLSTVRDLNECNNGQTALSSAVCNKNILAAKMLINCGADVNAYSVVRDELDTESRNETPLLTVVRMECSVELLQLLLNNGADVNSASKDEDGSCALIWATYNRDMTVMQLLLNHGANIDHCDSGSRSPIYLAGRIGHKPATQVLLDHGANMNKTGPYNDTGLLNSVVLRQQKVAKLLIQAGADVTLTDTGGNDSLMWAIITGDTGICKMLVYAGATITQKHLDSIQQSEYCDPNFYAWLEEFSRNPACLLHLCRLSIRKNLCQLNDNKSILNTVNLLPLPKSILEYLYLRSY